jgi:hypothetical protein
MAFMMIATLVGVALIAGGVVDYSSLVSQRMAVKEAANNAALAAASEMLLVGASEARAHSVAEAIARHNLDNQDASVSLTVADDEEINVTVSAPPRTFFPGPVALTAGTISETSVAEAAGQGNVCVISLSPDAPGALWFRANARLQAGGCLVYTNSRSTRAMILHSTSSIRADFICVSGGYEGPQSVVDGDILSDCPPVGDPLANRPTPRAATDPCDSGALSFLTPGEHSLPAGVRVICGDLTIGTNATLDLSPGTYVLRNSRLVVHGALTGAKVGLIFTGAYGGFTFFPTSQINLSAPTEGEMSGLLVFQRDETLFDNEIYSDGAERLVGTIYQPGATLRVDPKTGKVAAQSEYTVIVAHDIDLAAGPELVLNTDYGASDVPVPTGLGNNARNTIRLTR